jgi:hypothetical protein
MQNTEQKDFRLARLKKELDEANQVVFKLTKKLGPSVFTSPEYKKAKLAYRAYWDAVDGKE